MISMSSSDSPLRTRRSILVLPAMLAMLAVTVELGAPCAAAQPVRRPAPRLDPELPFKPTPHQRLLNDAAKALLADQPIAALTLLDELAAPDRRTDPAFLRLRAEALERMGRPLAAAATRLTRARLSGTEHLPTADMLYVEQVRAAFDEEIQEIAGPWRRRRAQRLLQEGRYGEAFVERQRAHMPGAEDPTGDLNRLAQLITLQAMTHQSLYLQQEALRGARLHLDPESYDRLALEAAARRAHVLASTGRVADAFETLIAGQDRLARLPHLATAMRTVTEATLLKHAADERWREAMELLERITHEACLPSPLLALAARIGHRGFQPDDIQVMRTITAPSDASPRLPDAVEHVQAVVAGWDERTEAIEAIAQEVERRTADRRQQITRRAALERRIAEARQERAEVATRPEPDLTALPEGEPRPPTRAELLAEIDQRLESWRAEIQLIDQQVIWLDQNLIELASNQQTASADRDRTMAKMTEGFASAVVDEARRRGVGAIPEQRWDQAAAMLADMEADLGAILPDGLMPMPTPPVRLAPEDVR